MCRYLILIRHAQTDSQYAGRFIGATDVPLSEQGLAQTVALTDALDQFQPQLCFCSPLRRTRQTLDPIVKKFNVPVEFHDDLREIDFGRWEGLTFDEIAVQYPKEAKQWATGSFDFTFPGGESTDQFTNRIEQAADRIVKEPADTLAVITHGGVIRSLICRLLGLPFEKYVLFDVKLASMVHISLFDGKGILTWQR